jgi:hypothetical protein
MTKQSAWERFSRRGVNGRAQEWPRSRDEETGEATQPPLGAPLSVQDPIRECWHERVKWCRCAAE